MTRPTNWSTPSTRSSRRFCHPLGIVAGRRVYRQVTRLRRMPTPAAKTRFSQWCSHATHGASCHRWLRRVMRFGSSGIASAAWWVASTAMRWDGMVDGSKRHEDDTHRGYDDDKKSDAKSHERDP